MAEKKKGFWSWLGFGKKDEVRQDGQSGAEEGAEQAEERFEQEAEQVKTQFERQAENIEEKIERKSERPEEKIEQITAKSEVEAFVEKVKEKAEQAEDWAENIEDRVEEKLAQVETYFEQKADRIEDFIEEKTEEVKAFFRAEDEQTLEREQDASVVDGVEDSETGEEIDGVPEPEEAIERAAEAESADETPSESAAEERFEEQEAREQPAEERADVYQEKPGEGGFFSRLLKGLVKTKQSIGSGFRHFFRGKKIDDELFEELEEQLLVADLGMPTTTKIIRNLTLHADKRQLKDADLLYQQLKAELAEVLKPVERPLEIDTTKKPYVILMVGVNGVGKTTTIGKLARQFQNEGKSVMLAAGDTFRAAAVEQLQVWGERNHIPVVAQSTGADSASVIFDAMQSAAAKGTDVLIADTAGRLQNKNNLMDELKKIVRVMKKYDESAPHEIMLTLDAGTGQNAISQAKLFNEAVGLTGIALTKLDGTAKGGVIFAIADQFNIPIRFIGVGEKIEDLRPFNATEFIEALFEHEE